MGGRIGAVGGRWEIPTGMEVAVDGRTPEGSPPPSRPYGHMGVELIGS